MIDAVISPVLPGPAAAVARRSTPWLTRIMLAVLAASGAAAAAEGLPVAAPKRTEPIRFEQEILPFLAANCTACHNAKIREGGLRLDSAAAIRDGGDSGAAVVAGKPAESTLFLRASHRQEDFMPPAGNKVGAKPLGPEQLGLLERWIAEGGQAGPAAPRPPVSWKPVPRGVGGVVAVAITGEGSRTAAARGSFVEVFDVASGLPLAALVDPSLSAGGAPPDRAHLDLVSAVAFDPTGDRLATGSFRTIKLWRRRPATRLAEIPDTVAATAVALAPDGVTIALGMPDGSLRLCAAATGKPIRTVAAHAGAVAAVCFSADSATIHSAGRDGAIVSTRVADGVAAGRLARQGELRALAVLGGGTRLAAAEADGVIRVWPLPLPLVPAAGAPAAEVKPLKELAGIPQPTTVLVEPPSLPGHLLSGGGDGSGRLWNVETGGIVRQFAHGGPIVGMAVSPDGARLATVGSVPGVKLWDLAGGAMVAETKGDHRVAAALRIATLSADVCRQDIEFAKTQVAAADKAVQTAAEEAKKAAELAATAEKNLAEKAAAAAATAKTKADADAGVARTAAELQTITAIRAAAATLATAAADTAAAAAASLAAAKAAAAPLPADVVGKLEAGVAATAKAKGDADAAAAAAETQLTAAKTRVADEEKKAAEAGKAAETAEEARRQAEASVASGKRAVEFAAERGTRATADVPLRKADLTAAEQALAAAEQARGKLEADAAAAAKPFVAAAFSRSGAWLACLDAGGTLVMLGGADGRPRRAVDAVRPAGPAVALATSADGRIVAAGGAAAAAIWDAAESWLLERTIGGERTPAAEDDDPNGPPVDVVTALAFSPDGQLLASGGGLPTRGGEIKFWKAADGTLARSLAAPHSDTVMDVEFSRRGDLLASAGADRLLKVHAVADGKHVRSFEGHTGHVLGVAWQAHGRRLASAGADGAIKVWDFVTGEPQRTVAIGTREAAAVQFVDALDEAVIAAGVPAVRTINLATAAVIREFPAPGDFVQSLAVARPFVVAGSQDGRLRIWNLDSAAALHTLEPAAAPAR